MLELKHGKYIGSRKDLQGETALIGERFGSLIAVQFDDVDKFGHDTDERLAYGWHNFPETDFQIDDEDKVPARFPVLLFMLTLVSTIYLLVELF